MKLRSRAVIALGGSLVWLCGVTFAQAAPSSYTCTGGTVPAGTYSSMTIAGVCLAPAGAINVTGNLTVNRGALLDAGTPGDLPGNPVLPAVVTVGGNVSVGTGAVLVLGCSPDSNCSSPPDEIGAIAPDRVGGNLSANGALSVNLHSVAVRGSVSIVGGGGGPSIVAGPNTGACFGVAGPAPWSSDPSLVGVPVYSDVEEASVGGNLTIQGVQTCWLGSLRNQVSGNVTYANNVTGDPDGMEVENGLVGGNLACTANTPAPQFGDGTPQPNIVRGNASGQCAFTVLAPDPAPAGPLENVSVRASSLGTYSGTYAFGPTITSTVVGPLSSGVTTEYDVNLNTLAGSGLVGSVTDTSYTTTLPDGSAVFRADDLCQPCSFDGFTGATGLRAYGTTTASGVTSGTFLIVTNGAGADLGQLANLVGYGTFTSAGQPEGTLHLVEHLGFTPTPGTP